MIQNVAMILRKIITDAFAKGETYPWPPMVSSLQAAENPVSALSERV